MNDGCTHLDRIHDVTPSSWGCQDRPAQGRQVITPGRVTAIIVSERLGF